MCGCHCPHPDDETLGAGGTIARLAESGMDVSVLVVMDTYPRYIMKASLKSQKGGVGGF